jgi:hypothetical protein
LSVFGREICPEHRVVMTDILFEFISAVFVNMFFIDVCSVTMRESRLLASFF